MRPTAVTVGDMTEEHVAGLRDKLTRAYLAGDGAEVVRLMELIARAEQGERAQRKAA